MNIPRLKPGDAITPDMINLPVQSLERRLGEMDGPTFIRYLGRLNSIWADIVSRPDIYGEDGDDNQ